MKPFARIILALSLVLAAAGAEWSIIRYRIPIQEFVFYNSSYVWGVRVALMVIGGMIIALAAALAVARRAFHRKCGIEIVSDRVALRGIAVAMLFVLLCDIGFRSGNSCKTQAVDFCLFSDMDVYSTLISRNLNGERQCKLDFVRG